MATTLLQQRLLNHLERTGYRKLEHGIGLTIALARTLARYLLLPVGPRAALLGFKFCQPFLMRTLLDYLQSPEDTTSKNIGYGLIGATILIYSGIAVSTSFYWYFHERALCMSRGCIVGVIYKKSTEVQLAATKDAATITLMSTDVERIRLGFLNLHEFWANTIEVALASWLLQRQLGTAFTAPLVVVIICIMLGTYTNRFTGQRQKAWMTKIQRRVGLTASVILHMKHLKISGLASPVERLIQDMRVDELKTASKFRIIYVLVITFGYIPTALCPVVTFAFTSRTLDVSTIFTSMSYIILLADPLGYLFQNTPNLLAAFACLDRIQAFLDTAPRTDSRLETRPWVKEKEDEVVSAPKNSTTIPDIAIKFQQASFGWEFNKPVLIDINLDIPRSSLTIIVGPVGAGKSSLCKSILGELSLFDGQISIAPDLLSRSIAYCDQVPYLTNATILDNVVAFSTFDSQRYNEVINAVALDVDISNMVLGDQTKVGSGGITLSGGQKQRVSIARALYAKTDIFVFDDVLSGLDADTGDQVFRNVFGPLGYLKRRGATTVLVTHNVAYLPLADKAVVMNAHGTISSQGLPQNIAVDRVCLDGTVENDQLISKPAQTPETTETLIKTDAQIQSPSAADMDDFTRMKGDPKVYKYYLSTLGTRSFVAFLVFGLGWGFFYNWGNVWLKFWSEDVASAHPQRSNSFYIGLYALFQMTYVLSMFFVFLICFTSMILVSGSKLHESALNTLISAPLSFFGSTNTGIITNMFSQDMTLIDHELPIAVTNLALDVCNALGMAAVIASSSVYLVITYPFLFSVLYVIQKFYLRTSRQLRLLDLEMKSPLYTHFLETMDGLATLRAFGWMQEGIKIHNQLLDTSQRPTYLLAVIQRWLLFALQVVVTILAVTVVTMATQLRSSTALTGASLVTLMTFGDILNYIIRWFTQIETSIGAVGRLKNFGDKVAPETTKSESRIPPDEWPNRGSLDIKNIYASYDTPRGNSDQQQENESTSAVLAIQDLTLSIRGGEKVAICGRSGSGKSSVILFLLKLLDPLPSCSGDVIIDDIPLSQINRTVIRERILAIPQEAVFLPNGTSVQTNLDPFEQSNVEECQSVLETVGLWPLFSERGGLGKGLFSHELSQGQKQLFSLARAVVRHRARLRRISATLGTMTDKNIGGILLLDEVSSNVDHDTDRAMQKVIMEEFKNYTIILVSHRLEMVMKFDTVVVMDKAHIVESGSPNTLVETIGTRFRELWLASH